MNSRKHKIFQTFFFIVASLSFATAAINFAATPQQLPFGAWRRASETPILSPQGTGWESAGVFNPAVVVLRSDLLGKSAEGLPFGKIVIAPPDLAAVLAEPPGTGSLTPAARPGAAWL